MAQLRHYHAVHDEGFPIHSCHVALTFSTTSDLFDTDTTPAALASAARLAVQAALREASEAQAVSFMEPVMNVVISCDESSLGAIVHDLSSARGGHVLSLGDDEGYVDSVSSETTSVDIARIYTPPDPFAASVSGERVVDAGGPGQRPTYHGQSASGKEMGWLFEASEKPHRRAGYIRHEHWTDLRGCPARGRKLYDVRYA